VGEAAGAPDTGYRDHILRIDIVFAHDALQSGEDPVVTTTLAPAWYFGLVVFNGVRADSAGFPDAFF
jgi:hypothetical protein